MPLSADSPNQLENMKGSVSYQRSTAAAKSVALKATVSLLANDYAITGADSLAQLTMPDSSQISVGSDTKVQMTFFAQTNIATAKFIVYQGKTRFAVRHPSGAKADYTFQTPTGTVAVRGTQGDIAYDQATQQLQVNVYEVCDPNNPVEVLTKGGQTLKVIPGQSFIAKFVNGQLQTQVQKLTQQMINQFSPDFGVPTSWDAAKGEVISYASNQVRGAVNGATGGVAGGAIGNAVSGFLHKATATPTPAPTTKPATCS